MRLDTAPHAKSASAENAGARRCLLCESARSKVTSRLASSDLEKAWRALGVTFSAEAWKTMNGTSSAELFECLECGFRYCDPGLAGNGRFYTELDAQRTGYYPAEVPEFARTLAWVRVRKLRTVLDVGCGDGAFLDLAREAGMGTAGIELNRKAAEACQSKGHHVSMIPLAELAKDSRGPRYDLVTLFQVLEHVPDPVSFLRDASSLLRPGGYVSVAVPNDRGIYRICPLEPHEWPPHHITRWRQKDLRQAGSRCGLRVVKTGANRLLGSEAEFFWGLHNRIVAALGRPAHPGGTALPKVLSFFYRKLGMKFILPGFGTSVYAIYQRE